MMDKEQIKTDIEKVYKEFWVDAVFEGKEPTLEQIKAELYDYSILMRNVAEVYCTITGGKISKQLTLPAHVIEEAEEYYKKLFEDA